MWVRGLEKFGAYALFGEGHSGHFKAVRYINYSLVRII